MYRHFTNKMKNAHVVLSENDDGDVSGAVSFSNSSYVHGGGDAGLSIQADSGPDSSTVSEGAYMDMPGGGPGANATGGRGAISNGVYMSVTGDGMDGEDDAPLIGADGGQGV
jgi:hypothetical protein